MESLKRENCTFYINSDLTPIGECLICGKNVVACEIGKYCGIIGAWIR